MEFEGPDLSSELTDWDEIENKEAVSFVYQLRIIGGVKKDDGTYEFQPDEIIPPPVVGCVMQNARACTGVEQDYMGQLKYMEAIFGKEATLTRQQAAELLMKAMTGGADGMPQIIFIPKTVAYGEFTTPEFGMVLPPEGKTLTATVGGEIVELEEDKTYKNITFTVE